MDDAHEYSEHAPTHHVTSLPVYFGVFIALMVFTILTVGVSRIDLGALNTPIALAIAVIKATLVILFFMHVIHSTRLTWVVILASLFWLALLFVLTLADYLTRGWQIY
ncbi:MAG TPA: cytochrome C oxidase subunit IV family protein [Thermoanaerobaculia bacterium]|nr:cytochrome C oxidase subunit IV family protein [Thermoanaerobaculia bacterium]